MTSPLIPPPGRKRGRPVDPKLQLCREMFPLWSERTIARYKASMDRMILLGASSEDIDRVFKQVQWKNGKLRVHLLDRYTRIVVDRWRRQAAQDEVTA